MVQFFQEIQEQPQALLQTANFYKSLTQLLLYLIHIKSRHML